MSSQTDNSVPRRRVSIRVARSAGVALTAIAAASLLTFATAKSALGATAIFIGGIGEPVLSDGLMSMALGGKYFGYDRVSLDWPAQAAPYWGGVTLGQSVAEGTDDLYDMLTDPDLSAGTVVIGSSAGSLVVDETMRRLDALPADSQPDKSLVSFVVIADGSHQDSFQPGSLLFNSLSGYTYQAPPVTKYNVDVVTYEYDGFADFPDRWWNLAAVANAVAGIVVLHNATYFVDLTGLEPTDTQNADGGHTYRYLIPAKSLPLVDLMPWLAPMEEQLKQLVDSGYSRNDQGALVSSAVTYGDSDDGAAKASVDAGTPQVTQKLDARAERAASRAAHRARGSAVNPSAADSNSLADDSVSRRTVRSLPHPVRDVVRSTAKNVNRGPHERTGESKTSASIASDSTDRSGETNKRKPHQSAADDSGKRTKK